MRTGSRQFLVALITTLVAIFALVCPISPVRAAPVTPGSSYHLTGGSIRLIYASGPGFDATQNFGDLYLPTGTFKPGSVPIVLLIHGGGWQAWSNLGDVDSVAASLASKGVAVYNIEYRRVGLGGGVENTMRDTAAAMDYLATIAHRFPALDLRNIIAVGHSAGGTQAAWLASRPLLPPGTIGSRPLLLPRKVISLAGILDLWSSAMLGNPRVKNFMGGLPLTRAGQYWMASPSSHPNPRIPLMQIAGTKDSVVPFILANNFLGAMSLVNGNYQMVWEKGANHVQIVSTHGRWWPAVSHEIITAATTK